MARLSEGQPSSTSEPRQSFAVRAWRRCSQKRQAAAKKNMELNSQGREKRCEGEEVSECVDENIRIGSLGAIDSNGAGRLANTSRGKCVATVEAGELKVAYKMHGAAEEHAVHGAGKEHRSEAAEEHEHLSAEAAAEDAAVATADDCDAAATAAASARGAEQEDPVEEGVEAAEVASYAEEESLADESCEEEGLPHEAAEPATEAGCPAIERVAEAGAGGHCPVPTSGLLSFIGASRKKFLEVGSATGLPDSASRKQRSFQVAPMSVGSSPLVTPQKRRSQASCDIAVTPPAKDRSHSVLSDRMLTPTLVSESAAEVEISSITGSKGDDLDPRGHLVSKGIVAYMLASRKAALSKLEKHECIPVVKPASRHTLQQNEASQTTKADCQMWNSLFAEGQSTVVPASTTAHPVEEEPVEHVHVQKNQLPTLDDAASVGEADDLRPDQVDDSGDSDFEAVAGHSEDDHFSEDSDFGEEDYEEGGGADHEEDYEEGGSADDEDGSVDSDIAQEELPRRVSGRARTNVSKSPRERFKPVPELVRHRPDAYAYEHPRRQLGLPPHASDGKRSGGSRCDAAEHKPALSTARYAGSAVSRTLYGSSSVDKEVVKDRRRMASHLLKQHGRKRPSWQKASPLKKPVRKGSRQNGAIDDLFDDQYSHSRASKGAHFEQVAASAQSKGEELTFSALSQHLKATKRSAPASSAVRPSVFSRKMRKGLLKRGRLVDNESDSDPDAQVIMDSIPSPELLQLARTMDARIAAGNE